MQYPLIEIAAIFLVLFTMVAGCDGFYFHLWKYRLFERIDSRREHLLHTWNALLFPFSVLFLLCWNSYGLPLYLGVGVTVLTLVIEFADVATEKDSRSNLGGLTSLEYSMHFGMAILRGVFTTLVLVSKPTEAWQNLSWSFGPAYPPWVVFAGWSIVVSGAGVALLHVVLHIRGKRNLFVSEPGGPHWIASEENLQNNPKSH